MRCGKRTVFIQLKALKHTVFDELNDLFAGVEIGWYCHLHWTIFNLQGVEYDGLGDEKTNIQEINDVFVVDNDSYERIENHQCLIDEINEFVDETFYEALTEL